METRDTDPPYPRPPVKPPVEVPAEPEAEAEWLAEAERLGVRYEPAREGTIEYSYTTPMGQTARGFVRETYWPKTVRSLVRALRRGEHPMR